MSRVAPRLLTAMSLFGVSCLFAGPAMAQEGKKPATAPAPATGDAQTQEKARVHYERGLQLFNEENYDAALFEFERANELAPSFKILYNMGRIQRQQNNYAAAIRSYARYLRDGGANVPAERRAEVEKEIAVLKPRVAEVTVKVNVDGANVYADDIPVCSATIESSCIGTSPLQAPIVVNGGRHKITATKRGFATATALVSVVGSDAVDVKLELVDLSRPVEAPYDPAPRNRALVAWGVTAVFTGVAVTTGILALNASSNLSREKETLNADPIVLKDQSDNMKSYSVATDIFGGVALVSAGVATYFTVKAVQARREEKSPEPGKTTAKVNFGVGPTGGALYGTF